jgi:16S rRNA (adenine1518-N6/adenine1519-N6)-dimethyltransferase
MSEQLPKKSLGQHWLYDITSLESVVDMAQIQPGDLVLEVGPGKGTLTEVLLNKKAKIIAAELDESLSLILSKKYATKDVEIINESILKFDFGSLKQPFKVVANIPYYLTSHLVRLLSELPNQPEVASLLVQKEVAHRICAEPGEMSLLSITAQFYWRTELGDTVKAYLFEPPPKVDSQVVGLFKWPEKPFEVDEQAFFEVVKGGFSSRRKKLVNSLSSGLNIPKQISIDLIESTSLNPAQRPQDLSLKDWYEIYNSYRCSNLAFNEGKG